MKILKHKIENPIYVYKIHCACGCVFEFDENDPLIQHDKMRPRIKCPECTNWFFIKPHFLKGVK